VSRTIIGHSAIHGRGLYAAADLRAGVRLIEYRGEVLPWDEASERYDEAAGVTYFFDRGDGSVIDGAANGNNARFINHGCAPNCEAIDHDGRIWIHTLRDIASGEELLIDYALVVDDPDDPEQRALYACRCEAPDCRRTMLAS
jgi:uncharacterized protein